MQVAPSAVPVLQANTPLRELRAAPPARVGSLPLELALVLATAVLAAPTSLIRARLLVLPVLQGNTLVLVLFLACRAARESIRLRVLPVV